MTQDITSLIEKLEEAEDGSRELDALVWLAIGSRNHIASFTLPSFTTSLNAALALAERVGLGDCFDIQLRPSTARVSRFDKRANVWRLTDDAATPSLALCAAILRAQSEAR